MKFLSLIALLLCLNSIAQISPKSDYDIKKVISHAVWQTTQDVTYDGRYIQINYPNGDVPDSIGVCTDVIIRSLRSSGVDLQKIVHESVSKNLKYYYPYPSKNFGESPDSNIDHRRVMVLRKFFDKHYPKGKIGFDKHYQPGDIIIWPGDWHIGILIDKRVPGTDRYYCVHNIGSGPVIEDVYYDEYVLTHYRINF